MTDSRKRKLDTMPIQPTQPGKTDRTNETTLSKAQHYVADLSAIDSPLEHMPSVKKHLKGILDLCKLEDNLDDAASAGCVQAVVSVLRGLHHGQPTLAEKFPQVAGVEEIERDICFIMGLMAIKPDHQQSICDADALPVLTAIIKRYDNRKDPYLSGAGAQNCRRASDAITNLAHENNTIKTRVRQEGCVPPLVALLRTIDPKVQRAIAGTLRTLAFKNEQNKDLIVQEGALPLLISMLHSEDTSIHYEAVGVIGNLVHSSVHIKRRVLEEGALQPVINLLSSTCPDSQREAALLLGQFATAEGDYKRAIVQRGAVTPLIDMLGSRDAQLKEMAAFALGRLAQQSDSQAGIMAMGALPPLMDLLTSSAPNLQHNAAFALYGLSEADDNLLPFVRMGTIQTIVECELGPQPSRDCIQKMMKRLQDRLTGRQLTQILYVMQNSNAAERRVICIGLGLLCTKDAPSPRELHSTMVVHGALDTLTGIICDVNETVPDSQRRAAKALYTVAEACGATAPIQISSGPIAPAEPRDCYLGAQYVNNKTLSDVTFVVEGKKFYAHRIALLASSEIFKSMFDGNYREREAASIPIPNIRWDAFRAMMECVYTGTVEVDADLAQELLEASDQYMLDTLKRLCEAAIASHLAPDNVAAAFELAENFNAPELATRCALYCLSHYGEIITSFGLDAGSSKNTKAYSKLFKRMCQRLRDQLVGDITQIKNDTSEEAASNDAQMDEDEDMIVVIE